MGQSGKDKVAEELGNGASSRNQGQPVKNSVESSGSKNNHTPQKQMRKTKAASCTKIDNRSTQSGGRGKEFSAAAFKNLFGKKEANVVEDAASQETKDKAPKRKAASTSERESKRAQKDDSAAPQDPEINSQILRVDNFGENVTETKLRTFFDSYGDVWWIKILPLKEPLGSKAALVKYFRVQDAVAAMSLNGIEDENKKWKISRVDPNNLWDDFMPVGGVLNP